MSSALGKPVSFPSCYAPELLTPIPRSNLCAEAPLPFSCWGSDRWTCYEVSFLRPDGRPVVGLGYLEYPATTPAIVESKSLKLYLGGFHFERLESAIAFEQIVMRDLSRVVGSAAITFKFVPTRNSPSTFLTDPKGECLDELPVESWQYEYSPQLLRLDKDQRSDRTQPIQVYSHLLRTLCPVTAQPDWGTVLLRYRGQLLDHAALLQYLVSFRQHPDFHEQCCEIIFRDLAATGWLDALAVECYFTRRGGIEINPARWSEAALQPQQLLRMVRQ